MAATATSAVPAFGHDVVPSARVAAGPAPTATAQPAGRADRLTVLRQRDVSRLTRHLPNSTDLSVCRIGRSRTITPPTARARTSSEILFGAASSRRCFASSVALLPDPVLRGLRAPSPRSACREQGGRRRDNDLRQSALSVTLSRTHPAADNAGTQPARPRGTRTNAPKRVTLRSGEEPCFRSTTCENA
jgi:hypothetical protein